MLDLSTVGRAIAERRSKLRLTQAALAKRAGIGRSTLDALENGRMTELGFSKIARLTATLGLELQITEIRPRRPTLEDLLGEDED
jgi:transcriptional regulator with XRE-family HTH domain